MGLDNIRSKQGKRQSDRLKAKGGPRDLSKAGLIKKAWNEGNKDDTKRYAHPGLDRYIRMMTPPPESLTENSDQNDQTKSGKRQRKGPGRRVKTEEHSGMTPDTLTVAFDKTKPQEDTPKRV